MNIKTAEAAMELKRRYEEEKLLFYKPCCRVHKSYDKNGKFLYNNCPVLPCPDSKHWKFHTSDKRIRVIFGSNRSSKTISCEQEFLMSACFKTHPIRKVKNAVPGRFRIYNSDFGIIEKLTIPSVREWIPRSALAHDGKNKAEAWDNSYDPKYHILQLKGGSTIDFMSYDQDSSKSESVDLDLVWADEQMPERVFTAVMARLITRNGKFIMGVTPLYDISWAMKFLDNVDPQVEVFHFDIYDNPYNSPEAIKDFEASIPEHEKEARLHGRFLELQGLVYKELRRDIHMVEPGEIKSTYPVIFAMDPHPRKATVMTWAYITPKDDVIFFDELEMKGTARDIAQAIRMKEKEHKAPTTYRIIDPAAKAQGSNIAFETDTLREFEREDMRFSLADNSEAGYSITHEYLSFDPKLPLSSMNRPRCFFTKDVQKTWFGMTHLLWDEWSFKNTLKDEKERIRDYKKDFPDCVRYTLALRPTTRSFNSYRPVPTGNWQYAQDQVGYSEMRDLVFGKVA